MLKLHVGLCQFTQDHRDVAPRPQPQLPGQEASRLVPLVGARLELLTLGAMTTFRTGPWFQGEECTTVAHPRLGPGARAPTSARQA